MRELLQRHPWIPACYLLLVSLSAFSLPFFWALRLVPLLILLQFALLHYFSQISTDTWKIFWRLKFLFLFLLICNAFFYPPAADDLYFLSHKIRFSVEGSIRGLLMVLQIYLVVLASYTVRTTAEVGSFVRGLHSMKVTPLLAYSLDATLALLEHGGGGGRGTGGGGGGGRGRRQQTQHSETAAGSLTAFFSALRRADFSPFFSFISRSLEQGRQHALTLGLDAKRAHDVGVLAGIGLVMMTFKIIKILPGIPYFSGAKAVFFIPLYILAAELTHSRWGGTLAGTIMGIIAFLNGDGRYGIFEIAKHIAPGFFIDCIWPGVKGLRKSLLLLTLLGILAAAFRTATEFIMVLCLSPQSAELFLFPTLKMIPNLIAGTLSGWVSYAVLRYSELSKKPEDAKL